MFSSSQSSSSSLTLSPSNFAKFLYSRKLSLKILLVHPVNAAASPSTSEEYSKSYTTDNRFDGNVVMVLAVILCALLCVLALNSIIRRAFGWSRWGPRGISDDSPSTQSGIEKRALEMFPTLSYSAGLNLPGLASDQCVICISEYREGEKVKVLPKCNHGFHVKCINKWLGSHSTCPTCRQCLLNTCKKIVGCSRGSLPEPANVSNQHVIVQLEPE